MISHIIIDEKLNMTAALVGSEGEIIPAISRWRGRVPAVRAGWNIQYGMEHVTPRCAHHLNVAQLSQLLFHFISFHLHSHDSLLLFTPVYI